MVGSQWMQDSWGRYWRNGAEGLEARYGDRLPEALFLAPGIGKQGATVSDLRELGVPLNRVVVSSSRGIAENGPDPRRLKDAVAALAKSSEG